MSATALPSMGATALPSMGATALPSMGALSNEFKDCVSLIVEAQINEKTLEFKDTTNEIMKTYVKYINDPTYVYKKCRNNLIVVLKKLETTITNENRFVNDPKYAKFRANELKVEFIFSLLHASTMYLKAESIYSRDFKYVVDQVVKSDFDEEINNISSYGIHY
jgi:hypothetical protein